MTATYLQVTVAIWGFLAATALGIIIHTVSTRRRSAAFDRHTTDMLALFADCWPEREHDETVTRCECGVLWTADRTCPHAAAKADQS